MNQSNEPRKGGKGGRPPKNDRAGNCLMVRFSDAQYAEFLSMYEQAGIRSKARFILARVFGEEFRVIKTDSSALDFVMKLSALYGQIRSVGVNYNQLVKQLYTAFGEKKALSLLYKLEQETIELSKTAREVVRLCEAFKTEYASK
jgi:hypothetical protein